MVKYWTGVHTEHKMLYHLVWIPKYRKRVLKGRIAERLKKLFEDCADIHRWEIKELNIQPDHVHMLVQLSPNISVSKGVQYFKGSSSRVIRAKFPELKEFLWGKNFWAEGYFCETVGEVDYSKIKEYIQNQ